MFGRELVRRLVETRAAALPIRVFDRVAWPAAAVGSAVPASAVLSTVGDVTDAAALTQALQGVHTVFHVAALIQLFPVLTEELRRANVDGTRTVLSACVAMGVKRCIYTSSLDAVLTGRPYDGTWEDLRTMQGRRAA